MSIKNITFVRNQKMKDMYEPIINCGHLAGENPSCWDGERFETEQECEEWIKENAEYFSLAELGGGVYPLKF